MEEYGKILIIAMPIFLVLILIEKWYGWHKGNDTMPVMDAVSSLHSGITNAVKDVLGLSVSLLSYSVMVNHLAVYHLRSSVVVYVVGFVAIDFYGYWSHRWAHQINFLWNKHAIHHSSEEFNLACALRQSVSSWVNLFVFLLLPAAILGVPAKVIGIILPIHLFMQFWYHTRHIDKLGMLEYMLVTPSHHRVHHAINAEYMDRNHGQIFIVWDKLFGTFQAELPEVPPVYGIMRPARTWNPILINYQHLYLMLKDAWRTQSRWDKLRIWAMPTGWRPVDVAAKYPVEKIEDVYHFEKYGQHNHPRLVAWSVLQLLVLFGFITHFFNHIALLQPYCIFIYGMFVFITVYSFSELMNKNPYALHWEAVRFLYCMAIFYTHNGWLALSNGMLGVNLLLLGYFIFSLVGVAWFVYNHFYDHATQKHNTL